MNYVFGAGSLLCFIYRAMVSLAITPRKDGAFSIYKYSLLGLLLAALLPLALAALYNEKLSIEMFVKLQS